MSYTPIQFCGFGYNSRDFLAQNEQGQKVIIKESSSNTREYLEGEASFVRECNHPNLVKYIDSFETSKSLFDGRDEGKQHFNLVLEYYETTLQDYIDEKGPLSTEEILHFLGDLASGLSYLHYEKNVVHRDIKPSNMLLKMNNEGELPTLKISEFAFVRQYEHANYFSPSPLFTAPELFTDKEYTSKYDLYSVGVTLYHMATKDFPFTRNKLSIVEAIKEEKPWKLPENIKIDEELHDLLKKLITFNEEERLTWDEFYEHPFVKRAIH